MEYGVFTSTEMEIAQTKQWALCFYCNADQSLIGAKLFNGDDDRKTLVAICERNIHAKRTVYAYESANGTVRTNDVSGVALFLGTPFRYSTDVMSKIDSIRLTGPYELSTVREKGIRFCLKQWRMGTSFISERDGFVFTMVTDKIDYVFSILETNQNIYCGASVSIPYEYGMFGSMQYFRFRNLGDNSQPFCKFQCSLGNDVAAPEVPEIACESNACLITDKGFYWPVKRFSDDEIVLHGCGGDEYCYFRNGQKSEFFDFQ